MRFQVVRASSHSYLESPCDGAVAETFTIAPGRLVTRWFIEIADIQALLTFVAQNGDSIIAPPSSGDDWPNLTIYDDYLE